MVVSRCLVTALVIAALSACGTATTNDQLPAKSTGTILAPPPPSEDIAHVNYECADGSHLEVTFDDQAGTATVKPDGAGPFVLYIAATGSGFAYADGGRELRGKGDEAIWTALEKPGVQCTVRNSG